MSQSRGSCDRQWYKLYHFKALGAKPLHCHLGELQLLFAIVQVPAN